MNDLVFNRKVFAAFLVSVFVVSALLIAVPVRADSGSINYGDVALSGGFASGNFPQQWDLTACDLVVGFTYDANGLVDDFGGDAHAWAQLGVRAVGYDNFNPTWDVEGAGVWLATDYDWAQNTFAPDPVGAPTQDLDDKMILQKAGGHGEGDYNLPSTPPDPWANYGVWFDRDGVDQWQANMWGMINGATYNTGGLYGVVMTLESTSMTTGTAYMTVNGVNQGFYTVWRDGPPDLYPAGMTFTGDMQHMQVFYGLYGYGATHSVAFKQITVTGCLNPELLDATASLWLNLANTDDIGTYFDVKVDVMKGDSVVASGTRDCLKPARVATTSASIPLTVTDPWAIASGETFSLTVSVRIGQGEACVGKGHKDGTLQLQYDSVTRNSNVYADFGAGDTATGTYYLHQGNVMNTNAPTLLKASTINRHPDRTKGGNPWIELGTWTSNPLP